MRSRSPLALIELLIMIMIFALAAALCLRAFVWADLKSASNADADMAALHAQSAAELLKGSGGDYSFAAMELGGVLSAAQYGDKLAPAAEQESLLVRYDSDWKSSPEADAFTLSAVPLETSVSGLESALIAVNDASGAELISFTVSWQKED